MRLQSRYNRAAIAASIFVVLVGGIAYYFLLRFALLRPVDEALKVEEQEILYYVKQFNKLPPESQFRDQRTRFIETREPEKRRFVTTDVLKPAENEVDISRELIFPVELNGKKYTAIVTKSQAETEDLLLFILSITTIAIVLLFSILYLLNRTLLKRLWQPFYTTLSEMKDFNLNTPGKISLPSSKIEEFNDLNEALNQMTGKIRRDYESIKVFADNASHEMQTPLAIINSKLDLLIQDADLHERNMQALQSIYDAVNKLTALNQSLVLLTKIENNQFKETSSVHWNEVIRKKIAQLEEFTESKNISVKSDLRPCLVRMNPVLADILADNLLSNAIRHNMESGRIILQTSDHAFSILNTAPGVALDSNKIFNRFQKGNNSAGIGLGLAIVKQICDSYRFKIEYSNENEFHIFKIIF